MKSVTVTVSATHTETLYPSLPGLKIEVRYAFTSKIVSDDQDWEYSHEITGLMVSVNDGGWEDAPIPSNETHEGNRFLAPLREAARKEAAKLEKQIQPDPLPVPELREYRHTMEQMFPKFRPITPDNDEAFYG